MNVYGGQFLKPLMDFLVAAGQDADILCLQEVFDTSSNVRESRGVRTNLFQEICETLPEFQGFFSPLKTGFDLKGPVDFNLTCGLAILVRSTSPVTAHGMVAVEHRQFEPAEAPMKDVDALAGNFQYVHLEIQGRAFTICNFYGMWYPGSKLDTPERLAQSDSLVSFLANRKGHQVVLGDFNLLPDTRSIRRIEEVGLTNLIRAFGIKTTRGAFVKSFSQYWDNFQEYTDYAFTSSGLEVLDFQVPEVAISDHLPLVVKIRFE
ncbi:MAG: endonuclease/exonuclease/phosphatase family protein [bacterium]|nr:endonuclease/exonuclease/phosphatase family protein [bacterium]